MYGMIDFIKSCYIKNDDDNFYLKPENMVDNENDLQIIKAIDQVLLKYITYGGEVK